MTTEGEKVDNELTRSEFVLLLVHVAMQAGLFRSKVGYSSLKDVPAETKYSKEMNESLVHVLTIMEEKDYDETHNYVKHGPLKGPLQGPSGGTKAKKGNLKQNGAMSPSSSASDLGATGGVLPTTATTTATTADKLRRQVSLKLGADRHYVKKLKWRHPHRDWPQNHFFNTTPEGKAGATALVLANIHHPAWPFPLQSCYNPTTKQCGSMYKSLDQFKSHFELDRMEKNARGDVATSKPNADDDGNYKYYRYLHTQGAKALPPPATATAKATETATGQVASQEGPVSSASSASASSASSASSSELTPHQRLVQKEKEHIELLRREIANLQQTASRPPPGGATSAPSDLGLRAGEDGSWELNVDAIPDDDDELALMMIQTYREGIQQGAGNHDHAAVAVVRPSTTDGLAAQTKPRPSFSSRATSIHAQTQTQTQMRNRPPERRPDTTVGLGRGEDRDPAGGGAVSVSISVPATAASSGSRTSERYNGYGASYKGPILMPLWKKSLLPTSVTGAAGMHDLPPLSARASSSSSRLASTADPRFFNSVHRLQQSLHHRDTTGTPPPQSAHAHAHAHTPGHGHGHGTGHLPSHTAASIGSPGGGGFEIGVHPETLRPTMKPLQSLTGTGAARETTYGANSPYAQSLADPRLRKKQVLRKAAVLGAGSILGDAPVATSALALIGAKADPAEGQGGGGAGGDGKAKAGGAKGIETDDKGYVKAKRMTYFVPVSFAQPYSPAFPRPEEMDAKTRAEVLMQSSQTDTTAPLYKLLFGDKTHPHQSKHNRLESSLESYITKEAGEEEDAERHRADNGTGDQHVQDELAKKKATEEALQLEKELRKYIRGTEESLQFGANHNGLRSWLKQRSAKEQQLLWASVQEEIARIEGNREATEKRILTSKLRALGVTSLTMLPKGHNHK